MAFEKIKENTDNIQNQAQAYIEGNLAYYKLLIFKIVMKSSTTILKLILVFLIFLMVLVFFSIAGAIAIGDYLDSYALGFLIVGGVYLVLAGLLLMFKNKIIEKPVLDKFSEIFFNN